MAALSATTTSIRRMPIALVLPLGATQIITLGNCSTPTADQLAIKLLSNSVISTPRTKFMCINIKDYYLCTPMAQYEYFRMKLELFSLQHHWSIQPMQQSWLKPKDTLRSTLRHVRTSTCRNHCTRTPQKKATQSRMQTKKNHTRVLDLSVATDPLPTCRWWFWHQIHWQRARPAPDQHVETKLWHWRRLGWKSMPQHNTQLGLQEPPSSPLHAKLCRRATHWDFSPKRRKSTSYK